MKCLVIEFPNALLILLLKLFIRQVEFPFLLVRSMLLGSILFVLLVFHIVIDRGIIIIIFIDSSIWHDLVGSGLIHGSQMQYF